MKKLLVLALIAIMVFAITACGGSKAPETTAAPEVTEPSVTEDIPDEEGIVPAIDIAGCNTFTDIIDTKLTDGMGYAQVKIGDTEVLLVSPTTFDNNLGEGERYDAAVEADVYFYDADGSVMYMGKVQAGGSSYPLAIKDGKLYVGNNHGMKIMTVDPELAVVLIEDEAYIEFDAEGNETYCYRSDINEAKGDDGVLEDDTLLKEYLTAYGEAEVLKFDVVAK